jgi:hypothetical protein
MPEPIISRTTNARMKRLRRRLLTSLRCSR